MKEFKQDTSQSVDFQSTDYAAGIASMSVASQQRAAPRIWDPEQRRSMVRIMLGSGIGGRLVAANEEDSSPYLADVDETTTFARLQKCALDSGNAPAIATRAGPLCPWVYRTYSEYNHLVTAFARSIASAGVPARTGLCLMGMSSLEWVVSYLGAQCAGLYAVTLPRNIPPIALKRAVEQSQASILVVGGLVDLLRVTPFLHGNETHIRCIVVYGQQAPLELVNVLPVKVFSWSSFVHLCYSPVLRNHREVNEMDVEFRMKTTMPSNVAAVVWTTQEQGRKSDRNGGVMLTHDNLTWTAKAMLTNLKKTCADFAHEVGQANQRVLAFSDLHRALPQVAGIHMTILMGACLYLDKAPLEKNLDGPCIMNTVKDVSPVLLLANRSIYRHLSEAMRNKGLPRIRRPAPNARGVNGGKRTASRLAGFARRVAEKIVKVSTKQFGFNPNSVWLCDGDLGMYQAEFFSGLHLCPVSVLGNDESTGVVALRVPAEHDAGIRDGVFLMGTVPVVSQINHNELLVCGRNVAAGYLFDRESTLDRFSEEHMLATGIGGFVREGTRDLVDFYGPASSIVRVPGVYGVSFAPHRMELALQCALPEMAHVVLYLAEHGSEIIAVLALDTVMSKDPLPKPTNLLGALALRRSRLLKSSATTVNEVETCAKWSAYLSNAVDSVQRGDAAAWGARSNRGHDLFIGDVDDGYADRRITSWHILREGLSLGRREIGIDLSVNRFTVYKALEEQDGGGLRPPVLFSEDLPLGASIASDAGLASIEAATQGLANAVAMELVSGGGDR